MRHISDKLATADRDEDDNAEDGEVVDNDEKDNMEMMMRKRFNILRNEFLGLQTIYRYYLFCVLFTSSTIVVFAFA